MKCVFSSVQFLSETFTIPKRIQRDVIINLHRSSCEVPVTLVRYQSNVNRLNMRSRVQKFPA